MKSNLDYFVEPTVVVQMASEYFNEFAHLAANEWLL